MKQKLILDLDSAGDDILALLYAALHPDCSLLAVTCVKGAAGDLDQVTQVALHTVEASGKDIPVYRGCDRELQPQEYAFVGDPVHFEEELQPVLGERIRAFNPPLKPQWKQAEAEHAVDAIYHLLRQYPGEIRLVATGPLTNIATLFQKYPDAPALLDSLYVLGGVFQIPGNMTPVLEYNIFADPEAANHVFETQLPIDLVPLDVCENNRFADAMLTRDALLQWKLSPGTLARNLADRFEIYIDIWRSYFDLVGFPLDDVMTVAVAIHPEWFRYSDPTVVRVETGGAYTRGQTIRFEGKQLFKPHAKDEKTVRVVEGVQGRLFLQDFLHTISQAE